MYVQSDDLLLCLLPIFSSKINAIICSIVDYCNCFLIGLLKFHLVSLQSALNAAALLIACIPQFYHISAFKTEKCHWLPLSALTPFKILFLIYKPFSVLD